VYSEQRVSGLELLATKRHALLTVPVHTRDRAQFEGAAVPGAAGAAGLVVVQHVMVRNPALMIERPYTPINDVAADGEMAMVVKRVKGGEVGR
jgi:cytochrome-b5 reductase